jgi:hypothetical protein
VVVPVHAREVRVRVRMMMVIAALVRVRAVLVLVTGMTLHDRFRRWWRRRIRRGRLLDGPLLVHCWVCGGASEHAARIRIARAIRIMVSSWVRSPSSS